MTLIDQLKAAYSVRPENPGMPLIEQMRVLYEASTQGPWRPCRDYEDFNGPFFDVEDDDREEHESRPFVSIEAPGGIVINAHDFSRFEDADAMFIALAHNLMPDLLEAVEFIEALAGGIGMPQDSGETDMRTCLELPDMAFELKVEQHEDARALFRVTYGKQVKDNLTYSDAAREFGEAVFHALACAGTLYNGGE